MTKRLQVLMPEKRYREIRKIARDQGSSLGAWVRQAIEEAARRVPRSTSRVKRAALQRALTHGFPAPPIQEMLAEIEAGCGRVAEE